MVGLTTQGANMPPLFRPPGADPLATRADTWPYIHNICGYLSLNNAKMYRDFIQYFEDGTIPEATLATMVRESHIFDDLPDVSLLHDDLVIVILVNKADENLVAKAASAIVEISKDQRSSRNEHAPSAAVPGYAEHAGADDNELIKTPANVAKQPENGITLSLRPAPTMEVTPALASLAETAKIKRVRHPVRGSEKRALAQEAEKFLVEGKRSIRQDTSSAGTDGS
ncbi:hypothetical protein SLS60_011661 [Paraconiothyrium brasiliense]|uniref:Uncharacterized protein n=1 Tax=Paraconiothyrium brasiliense TaxID=300254 RepID=A0ABR3QI86_9PLEO